MLLEVAPDNSLYIKPMPNISGDAHCDSIRTHAHSSDRVKAW